MFSSTTTRSDNQEEKKPLISQTNSSKVMTSQSEPATSQLSPSASQISQRKSTRPPGPKMSDGSEFDSGPWGWVFSILYLFFLWGLCIAFAIGMVYFQYTKLDPKYPTYFGDGGFLGHIPRMSFDPNPKRFVEVTDNIMYFNIYDSRTYMNFLIRMKKVLKSYIEDEKQGQTRKELCNKKKLTRDEACKFDRYTGFDDCQFDTKNLEHGLGFSKGTPCLMLKINKLIGWEPKFLKNQTCPAGNNCCGEGIKFACKSNDDIDFQFYPKTGIPACYFPYANQPGYEQPYVMVKMSNISRDTHVTVECWPTNPELKTISGDKLNVAKFFLKMTSDSLE